MGEPKTKQKQPEHCKDKKQESKAPDLVLKCAFWNASTSREGKKQLPDKCMEKWPECPGKFVNCIPLCEDFLDLETLMKLRDFKK